MIDLHNRSTQKELLDADHIPFEDIKKNMQELNTVNTLLGGHKITLDGLKKLLPEKAEAVWICEIGCGGGDNLFAIEAYCRKHQIQVTLTGIDIKPACIAFAKERASTPHASWIESDYAAVKFDHVKPDIIFSSLFCHHFTEEELVSMLHWMQKNSSKGFFINDLHRHPLAYYSIKWITKIFSRSYLVKNDACLSVARAFKRQDWENILSKANIKNYQLQWKWAFRYLLWSKHME